MLSFDTAQVAHSNLGGLGPHTPTGASAGAQGIRYVNVGSIPNPSGSELYLDLLLTNQTSYMPYSAAENVLRSRD